MSEYIKTEWETGDVITADKLNNMEDGINQNSKFHITFSSDNSTLTPKQIRPGLGLDDFIGEVCTFLPPTGKEWRIPIITANTVAEDSQHPAYLELSVYQNAPLYYVPETGELSLGSKPTKQVVETGQ